MRALFVILVLGFAISCAKKESTSYVQELDIQLEQPRIFASDVIIDSSVNLTSKLRMKNVDIYYTNDGSEPSKSSNKYESSINVKKEGLYRFKAFHTKYTPSEISEITLYKKGITPSDFTWNTKASTSYPGLGDNTLINHKKASLSFRDKQWLGFDTIANANLSFKTYKSIKTLTITYLVDTKSWIFPPEFVLLIINKSDTLKVEIDKIKKADTLALDDIEIPINKNVKQMDIAVNPLKVIPDWHPGKGSKAWLFMDEWIFNE